MTMISMSRVLLLSILCTCAFVEGLDMKLYVNRVLVHKVDVSTEANVNNAVDYIYVEGDPVEVSCIRLTQVCKLKLSFDFFDEHIGGNGSIGETKHFRTEYQNGVGLRTTLQARHNDTGVMCACVGAQHTSIITVTFVLSNSLESMLNLKVDGYIVRQRDLANTSIQVYYACDETLHLEWASTNESVVLEAYQFEVQGSLKKVIEDKRLQLTKCLYIHSVLIQYVTRNNSTALHTMEVYFDKYYIASPETRAPLGFNISHSLLQLYNFNGRQLIYYDYEKNETLTITCSVPANIVTNINYLIFGDTVERNQRSIVKRVSLHAADDTKTLDCYMLNKFDNQTEKHTRLVWRQRPPVTDANTENKQWMIAVASGAGGGVVVLACLTVLCWRRRKRLKEIGDGKSEEKLCDDDSILPHPPQWTLQSAPANQRQEEPTYSEVLPSASRAYALETTTKPKPEIIYAALDLSSCNRDPKRVHTEECPYAEVLKINISERNM